MNSTHHRLLLSPGSIGDLQLTNRVVMAPLARNIAGDGEVATAAAARYYGNRADAGLIITEATQISAQGKGRAATAGIFTDAQITSWKEVTDEIHAGGGRVFSQLWHAGRVSHPALQPGGVLPIAPSAICAAPEPGIAPFVTPRALAADEIPEIIAQYEQAARNARDAGFDGVEIHAGNGYLIDQFLQDGSNHRTDAYGGPVENRARFLTEVVEAVLPVFGADRVGVRLSPTFSTHPIHDSDPEKTFGYVAEALGQYRLGYLHVIHLDHTGFDFRELKRRFSGTYMANGGFDGQRAEQALRNGEADFVSFGMLYAANADLVERFKWGSELKTLNPMSLLLPDGVVETEE